MSVILHVVVFILKIIDKISNFLELFGIKIMKINRKTLLQGKCDNSGCFFYLPHLLYFWYFTFWKLFNMTGFPPEIHEEVNEPDIKFLFDKTMEVGKFH